METHFAPPERVDGEALRVEIDAVTSSPIVDSLLRAVDGLVAVLDEHRQVLALNHELLRAAGVDRPEAALGLRPGELLGCAHAHEMEAGCGTSRFCSTCGAAIAITTSLAKDEAVERMCALHVQRGDQEHDLYLSVRACPIRISGQRFLLLFMQDVSRDQELEALQRIFFHDVNNLLSGLLGGAEVLEEGTEDAKEVAHEVAVLARRLHREMVVQRALTSGNRFDFRTRPERTTLAHVVADLEQIFAHHPVATGLKLGFTADSYGEVAVDVPLLLRVLANMITNACEASQPGQEVRVVARLVDPSTASWSVWNPGAIPEAVQRRVFQRNFSTKSGGGRGLGTYSMKLLGETFLRGRVRFTSSPDAGTTFELQLPVHGVAERIAGG